MIKLKSPEDIKILREGGVILSQVLDVVEAMVRPGAFTGDLEDTAERLIKEAGGRPSFKGYQQGSGQKPFPTVLCVSVNDEIVHSPAYPSREIKESDVVGLDIGMEYPYGKGKKGYYTDMARTVGAGEISHKHKKLIEVTRKCLELAIEQVKPGNKLSDIGRAVQTYAEANGFSVVRDLVGHGVGFAVHEDPQVPNYVPKNEQFKDIELKPGMVFAIEPMVNEGGWEIKVDKKNGFSIRTRDGLYSAHFEHTVAVIDGGRLIITAL